MNTYVSLDHASEDHWWANHRWEQSLESVHSVGDADDFLPRGSVGISDHERHRWNRGDSSGELFVQGADDADRCRNDR